MILFLLTYLNLETAIPDIFVQICIEIFEKFQQKVKLPSVGIEPTTDTRVIQTERTTLCPTQADDFMSIS